MSGWEEASVASVYLTTIIWCIMAAGAYVDCWREWFADRHELTRTENSRFSILTLVAVSRFRRAGYFVKMAHMKVGAGLFAALFIYTVPPEPDPSPLQAGIRVLLILDIYWFWRAKRTDRGLREKTRTNRG